MFRSTTLGPNLATIREVWRYGCTRVVMRMAQGETIATLDVTGVCTRDILSSLRRDALLYATTVKAGAIVIDFRHVAIMVGEDDLPMPGLYVPFNVAAMPVALVAQAHDERLFLRHAEHQARAGLIRAVFTCPDAAYRWAYARAEVNSV